MDLSNFNLLKEDSDSYHIGHPNGRSIRVPKTGLNDKAHKLIKKLKPLRLSNEDGGSTVVPGEEEIDLEKVPEDTRADSEGHLYQPGIGDKMYEWAQEKMLPPPEASPTFLGEKPASISPDLSQQVQTSEPQEDNYLEGMATGAGRGLDEAKQPENIYMSELEEAGRKQQDAYNEANAQLAKLETPIDIQKRYSDMDSQLLQSYQNKEIDPDHLWAEKGTSSRVFAGLGLLLSGMGSGMTGQENLAYKAINSAIDRDIDAQKNDQSKRLNLWKMNREHMKDDMDATTATRNQILTGLQIKASQAAAMSNNALVKMRANTYINQLQQQKDIGNEQRAAKDYARQTGDYGPYLDSVEKLDPKSAASLRERYVPGVGFASRKLSEKDNAGLVARAGLTSAIRDAIQFAKRTGPTIPGTPADAVAQQNSKNIALKLNEALNGLNRLNEIEAKEYFKMVGDLGGFWREKTYARLNNLLHLVSVSQNSAMKSLGVQGFQGATSPDSLQSLERPPVIK